MTTAEANARADATVASLNRWSRLGVTLLLAYLGWRGFHNDDPQAGVFWLVDGINLAVHEAGHMVFAVFGDTMRVLGGSLFQCLLPLIFALYFLRKERRDVHAATVCLWWLSTNLLSVSIYMADARARQLMLITGGNGDESDGHDWYHLFAGWHVLRLDTKIAAAVRAVAVLLCLGSVLTGALAAWGTGKKEERTVQPQGNG